MTETLWKPLGHGIEAIINPSKPDEPMEIVWLVLGANGKEFCLSVTAPKGVLVVEVINAFRAAAAHTLRRAGGDISQLGARPALPIDAPPASGAIN